MIQFDHIEFLNVFWLFIPLILLFVWFMFWRKTAISSFAENSLMQRLSPKKSNFKHYFKFLLILIGIAALIIGLSNPQIGTKFETVKREGVDVMIAVDVSRSMNAKDIQPSRMLKARQFVSNLINEMSNDRIGLIVFAGNAYLQMPLTVDYSATKMYLKQINTDLVPTQGTAIGDAVVIAEQSYPKEQNNQKVLIIISDGENHEGNAEDAIKSAQKNGIKIITIGVGTSKGSPIPIGRKGDFKKDSDGNIVITKLNEQMLSDLAREANGKYFNVNEENVSQKIINELGALDGKVFEEKVITDYKDHFQIFLLIALIILILEFIISFRKSKFSLNIFNK